MSQERRLVILVPTARDTTDENYIEVYWPNFVEHVKELLEGTYCRVMVADVREVVEQKAKS